MLYKLKVKRKSEPNTTHYTKNHRVLRFGMDSNSSVDEVVKNQLSFYCLRYRIYVSLLDRMAVDFSRF